MAHNRYIVDEREIDLLDRYEGTMSQRKDPHRYNTFDKETLAVLCKMKDRSNDMFFRRYQAAQEVIDIIAKQVGINPDNTGYWLYAPDCDGSSPTCKTLVGSSPYCRYCGQAIIFNKAPQSWCYIEGAKE